MIFNNTQGEHRVAVLRIIRKVAIVGLQLDFDKSEFEYRSIKYLEFIIEIGVGLQANHDKP